jgi:hypothetical protein
LRIDVTVRRGRDWYLDRIASHRIAHGDDDDDDDDDGTDRDDKLVLREERGRREKKRRRKTRLDYHATTRIFLELQ